LVHCLEPRLRAAPATMHQSTSRPHPCMSSRHATGPEAHLFGMAIAAFGLGRAFKSATELQRASQRQELRTPRAIAAAHAERCTVTPIIPSITIEHFVIGITAAEVECWHAAPMQALELSGRVKGGTELRHASGANTEMQHVDEQLRNDHDGVIVRVHRGSARPIFTGDSARRRASSRRMR